MRQFSTNAGLFPALAITSLTGLRLTALLFC